MVTLQTYNKDGYREDWWQNVMADHEGTAYDEVLREFGEHWGGKFEWERSGGWHSIFPCAMVFESDQQAVMFLLRWS